MGTPPEENSLACLMGTMESQSVAEVGSSPMLENLDTGLGLCHCSSPVLEDMDTAMHLEPRVYENLEMTMGIDGRRRVLQRAEGNQESNENERKIHVKSMLLSGPMVLKGWAGANLWVMKRRTPIWHAMKTSL